MNLQVVVMIVLAVAAGMLKLAKDKPKMAELMSRPVLSLCDWLLWPVMASIATMLWCRWLIIELVDGPVTRHQLCVLLHLRAQLQSATWLMECVMFLMLAVVCFLTFCDWFGKKWAE